jgi:hypothetical protein
VHQGAFTHEPRENERSDRAVRWVLRGSLAIAVVPMAAAVALVGPSPFGLGASSDSGRQSEFAAERHGAGEQLRGLLARGASGIVRAVKGEAPPAKPEFGVLDVRPYDLQAGRAALGGDAGEGCPPGEEQTCADAVETLRPDSAMRLQLIELPRFAAIAGPGAPSETPSGRLGVERRAVGEAEQAGWLAPAQGVFLREVGDALFVIEGEVAVEDLVSLRPISAVGAGSYLSVDPELHHSALSGAASRRFSQGRWTLRPEIDVGASYLDLDRVRLDAGQAGLFLPDTEDWIFSASPSVALEGEIDPVPGITLLPSVSAGATWLSQTDFQNAALMLDAPIGVAGLSALTPLEDTFANVEAGIGLAAAQRIQLSVRYGRLFGETLDADTGRVQLNVQF